MTGLVLYFFMSEFIELKMNIVTINNSMVNAYKYGLVISVNV